MADPDFELEVPPLFQRGHREVVDDGNTLIAYLVIETKISQLQELRGTLVSVEVKLDTDWVYWDELPEIPGSQTVKARYCLG